MLRINLLPPYIHDAAKRRTAMIGSGLLVAAVIAGFVVLTAGVQAQLSEAEKRKSEADAQKSTYDSVDAKIKKINSEIAQTKEKQTFVADARDYNDAWPDMFKKLRDVTSNEILLMQLSLDEAQHKTVNFRGFAQKEVNIIRWWMYLRSRTLDVVDTKGNKLPALFETVWISLPSHPYDGAVGGTQTGFGTRGGMGMGMMGGGPGGMGMMGAPMGGRGMMGGGMSAGKGAAMMGGGMMGGAGFGRGAAAAGAGASETEVEGKRGLDFTAVAVLKEPMAKGKTVPSWPAAPAAGSGAIGGMGMMGGAPMGGMMGGMPGGAMGAPAGGAPAAGGAASDGGGAPRGRRGKGGGGDD